MSMATSSSSLSPRQELAIDMLRSMKQQESGAYRIPTSHLESILNGQPMQPKSFSQHHHYHHSSSAMNTAELSAYLCWRRQMIEWCYRIAATCRFSKETVEICVSLLDRYVATCPNTIMLDAGLYQLACMACLYTSCKMNEPTCLSPQQMEKISGCTFDNQALQAMEVKILNALAWKVNPPTAIAFARCLLDAIVDEHNSQDFAWAVHQQKEAILEAVEIQIEQATADELFLPIRASGIAFAAVLNASRCHLPPSGLWKLEQAMSGALGYETSATESSSTSSCYHRHQKIEKLQNALLALVALSHGYELCPPLDEHDAAKVQQQHSGCMTRNQQQSKSAMDIDYFRPYSPRSVAKS